MFHHKNQEEKEYEIGYLISRRWSILEKELEKCQLLCFNCHREIHDYKANKENIDYKIKTQNKLLLLDIKNQKCCQECGYDKNIKALEFHHINKSEKIFGMSLIIRDEELKEINDVTLNIKNELEKCLVLCSNCHRIKHINIEKFEKNKNNIYLKSKNIKENNAPIDRSKVKEMYESGVRQVDIARQFNTSRGCISEIIHNFGYGESMEDIKVDDKLFLILHNEGKTKKEIKEKLKCCRHTLWELYKKHNIIGK